MNKISRGMLRSRLRKIKDETKCELCPQTNIWNGLPLKMEIDHIDGNNQHNELSNLRFLCPNCHSQTPTYCRNKQKKRIKIKETEIIKLYVHDKKPIREILLKHGLSDAGGNYKFIKMVLMKHNVYETNPLISLVKYEGSNILLDPKDRSYKRKVNRPSKEELCSIIEKQSISEIANQFNVTGNSIRKWCRSYGIDHKKISPFSHK